VEGFPVQVLDCFSSDGWRCGENEIKCQHERRRTIDAARATLFDHSARLSCFEIGGPVCSIAIATIWCWAASGPVRGADMRDASTSLRLRSTIVVRPHHSLSLRLRLPLTRKFLRLP